MSSPPHPSLRHPPADLIAGQWIDLVPPVPPTAALSSRCGPPLVSRNPARPAEIIWSGTPVPDHVDQAIAAARHALGPWMHSGRDKRFAVLRRYQQLCKSRSQEIADLICDESGKAMLEAKAEAAALAAKVDITLDASDTGGLRRVSDWQIDLGPGRSGRTIFRPHGVMAVVGPFNFPAHLPNGHIVPALAMGNTVILKPSDKAPAVGQLLGELFADALEAEGFGPGGGGVINVVQGAADIASRLVSHDGLDGILFTGSWPVGRRIVEANLDRPGRIVALELGGNNAAVVMPDADLRRAVIECVRSAFATAGQRCTCLRRIIVHESIADRFLSALCKTASNLIVGDPRAPHPVFMGPMISADARQAVLDFQEGAAQTDGRIVVPCTPIDTPSGGWYLSPGVMTVDRFVADDGEHPAAPAGRDTEVFGPLLRITSSRSLDDAIAQANSSRFGLAASIFTRDAAAIDRFLAEARAGCININTGTAGASSRLPFGGLGHSGNHRPAGSFSLDYCAYPVAAMIEEGGATAIAEGMRFDDAWLR